MDNANLPPAGDLSIDPTRDTPQSLVAVSTNNSRFSRELDAPMVMRLGASVVKRWSTLPRDVQETLFAMASTEATEGDREALARFLHVNGNGMEDHSAVKNHLE